MKLRSVKQYLSVIFILSASHAGFSQGLVDVPLITLWPDNMLKSEFNSSMSLLSEDPDNDVKSFAAGFNYGGYPATIALNASYTMFKSVNSWLSIPFLGAGAVTYEDFRKNFTARKKKTDEHEFNRAQFVGNFAAGSGLILKNRFFNIGLMTGLNADDAFDEHRIKFIYGVFPVLNTEEYPLLGFLKKISGFLYKNADAINNARIENLYYMLNLAFKRPLGLSVFELYTYNGLNDFIPGYDLSYNSYNIRHSDKSDRIVHSFELDSKGRSFKTVNYGLRIGSRSFVVDLNYLMIDGGLYVYAEQVGPDGVIYSIVYGNDIDYSNIDRDRLKKYKYPFGLNGFPSATFYFMSKERENFYWFLRFNTLKFNPHAVIEEFVPYIIVPNWGGVYQHDGVAYALEVHALIYISFSIKMLF
ncbi:MAG: hypothetical protein FWG13_01370 [Leptospirales bacterium]|nr:hypothetical protein [Leptospirales bacterium]